ncbi:MAG: TetR/AcrR family transcriptional regulator [Proteobacteria bacterium]|nr:TetR/AcrR family transcriptional regulator [Pseudomonadota bacterium]
MQTSKRPATDDVREAILNVAETRLFRFGYHKTTMAEIADDVGMSAANLYRYFENKQDIVAECASRTMDERLERLRAITNGTKYTPAEKLVQYALELVDDSHSLVGSDSMIGELCDTITRERPSLLHAKNEIHYALIGEILSDGVANGDFATSDIEQTARHIHSAFMLFDVPLFVGFYDREEFNQRAIGVANLMINGLRRQPATQNNFSL